MIDRGWSNVMIIGLLSFVLGCSDPEEASKPCDTAIFFVDEDGDGFGSPMFNRKLVKHPQAM